MAYCNYILSECHTPPIRPPTRDQLAVEIFRKDVVPGVEQVANALMRQYTNAVKVGNRATREAVEKMAASGRGHSTSSRRGLKQSARHSANEAISIDA